ncbi:MAG: 4-(cytidine 5'-diphospho)-2-C-methyl-D-erythritol kinase [Bacilli bacterium]
MKDLVVRSYAKINICLNVNERRSDGFHNLDMVMVPVELHDSLLISELKNADNNFVTIDDFSNGNVHYNLASSALTLIEQKYHLKNRFRVSIHKSIPMQAGLGGGSSNAAFVLKGINRVLKLNIKENELIEIARQLGSDVPFFIPCKPARCHGTGDDFEYISIKNNYFVLIVKPDKGCSTKDVFDLSDTMTLSTGNVDDVVKGLTEGDDQLLSRSIVNSLEEPAIKLVPEIKIIKERLINAGFSIVSMTGSGSAVFALSTNLALIKSVARKLEDKYLVEVTSIIK